MSRVRYIQLVRFFVLFDVLFTKAFKASDVKRFCGLFFLLMGSPGERVYSVENVLRFKYYWQPMYSALMSLDNLDDFNQYFVEVYSNLARWFPLKKRGVK